MSRYWQHTPNNASAQIKRLRRFHREDQGLTPYQAKQLEVAALEGLAAKDLPSTVEGIKRRSRYESETRLKQHVRHDSLKLDVETGMVHGGVASPN